MLFVDTGMGVGHDFAQGKQPMQALQDRRCAASNDLQAIAASPQFLVQFSETVTDEAPLSFPERGEAVTVAFKSPIFHHVEADEPVSAGRGRGQRGVVVSPQIVAKPADADAVGGVHSARLSRSVWRAGIRRCPGPEQQADAQADGEAGDSQPQGRRAA